MNPLALHPLPVSDETLALFADTPHWAVGGQPAIAVADFRSYEVRKSVTIIAVNDLGVLVEDADGQQQWFDTDGQFRDAYSGRVTVWLEAA
jgi:hypothetical protein